MDDRIQSQRATPEELLEHLGILPYRSPNCIDAKAALGLDVNGNPIPTSLEATATAVDPMETGAAERSLPAMTGRSLQESLSTATATLTVTPRA
ncbi:hypothetical protein CGMCC3_g9883 [Colletotrichum fructicola]|nr:uncharacterized protein CGMCC3_g9883 [Colletotrichum fructicola]KAE9573911.1 hypothetical protein CGMCC3_g9883 [Colletotrichum fructicola]